MSEEMIKEFVQPENLVYKKTLQMTEKVISYCPGCKHWGTIRDLGSMGELVHA